jgi:hypothetical protein
MIPDVYKAQDDYLIFLRKEQSYLSAHPDSKLLDWQRANLTNNPYMIPYITLLTIARPWIRYAKCKRKQWGRLSSCTGTQQAQERPSLLCNADYLRRPGECKR